MDNETPPDDQNSAYGYSPQAAAPQARSDGSSLGGGKGKKILIIVGMVLFIGFMLNSIFGDSEKSNAPVDLRAGAEGKETKIAKGEETSELDASIALPPPPKATLQQSPTSDSGLLPPPELPPVLETPTELIPPPPPPPPVSGAETSGKLSKTDKEMQARIRSNMLIVDGTRAEGTAARDAADNALSAADSNRAWASYVIKGTNADKEVATRLNNLSMTIAQGKIINAVLESAINTQLPGTIRAIVSRDTYAETGRTVLIPKGSRLIGQYNTSILRGQNRVMIVWTRLIRPDGIDIMIGSPGVDGLGRAGLEGFVDNRYMEIFSAAILTTALSIGAAVASDRVMPDKSTTTTGSGGSTTTNTSPAQKAGGDAVENLTAVSKSVVQNIIDIRPTVTVDQGTRINVFVNRDLTFPSEMKDALFVQ